MLPPLKSLLSYHGSSMTWIFRIINDMDLEQLQHQETLASAHPVCHSVYHHEPIISFITKLLLLSVSFFFFKILFLFNFTFLCTSLDAKQIIIEMEMCFKAFKIELIHSSIILFFYNVLKTKSIFIVNVTY